MSLLSSVMRGLGSKSGTYDISAAFTYLFGGGAPSKSGVLVSADEALKCSTVLAAVRAMANGIAQSSFGLYRPARNGRGREPARDHYLWRLLYRQPNAWMTAFEYREMVMVHTLLCGNHVSWKNRLDSGRVVELIPLRPGTYTIRQKPDWSLEYIVTLQNGESRILSGSDVLHIRGMMWNTDQGLELLRLAREAIGLAVATEETHARLHSNGARPSGILTSDSKISADDAARLRAMWQDNYGGSGNAGRTAVLGNGLKWQATAMTGVDAQHLETRRFQIEEICRAIGVFPQMVGHSDKTATYASAEAFFQAHVRLSLTPWAERLEQAFDRDLLTEQEKEQGYETKHDLRSLERGDTQARTAFYASGISNGWLLRNEAREAEGLNPKEGLDQPLWPLNMGTGPATKNDDESDDFEQKLGRVLSGANENLIRRARDHLDTVLSTLPAPKSDEQA
jgi:HK97 family phage portal protein